MYGKDNAVYYIMPAAFKTISKYTDSNYHLGAIQGETNVKMYGTGNTVYLSSGISAARLIRNTGKMELEGASNIVYSSFPMHQLGKLEFMVEKLKRWTH